MVNTRSKPLKRATVARARSLRRNSTNAENKLWQFLRNRGLEGAKFRRQVPIDRYFADFCCGDLHLIIELDGEQHAEQERYDVARTAQLNALGYKIIRFASAAVMRDVEGVVDAISQEIRRHA